MVSSLSLDLNNRRMNIPNECSNDKEADEKKKSENIFNADVPFAADNNVDRFIRFLKNGDSDRALLEYQLMLNNIKNKYRMYFEESDINISNEAIEHYVHKQIQDRLRESTGVTLSEYISTHSDNPEESKKQEELFA